MANRVLLSADGLKVSKPGVNVLTAADEDLLFSSGWSQYSLLMKGEVTVDDHFHADVSYGKTFDNIPLVCIKSGTTAFLNDFVEYEVGGGGDYLIACYMTVGPAKFRIFNRTGSNATFQYIVWNLDL